MENYLVQLVCLVFGVIAIWNDCVEPNGWTTKVGFEVAETDRVD